jgi:oligosaccharide repeat unit polymerase
MLFGKKSTLQKPEIKVYNYKNVKLLAVAFLLIGLAGYGVFLSRIGGLVYLLTNLDKRIELQSGQYVLILLPFLIFSSLSFLLCIRLKNKILDKILFALVVITTLFVFSSFGARKTALLFIITLIVAAHFLISIKLNKKTLVIGAFLAFGLLFYVLIIPVLRLQKGEDGERAEFKVKNLAYQTTYAYIDIFAANYFTPKTVWYFKGFLDPVIVPFSKLEKSKLPQIDQGVYFNAIVENNKHYEPPMPRDQVSKTSWPTENFGFAYANLLLPGVVLFFFLQGMVFSLVYKFLDRDIYNPILIMLYVLVVFDFNFSSLRIAEFVRTIPIVVLGYIVFAVFSKNSKPNPDL